MNKRIVAGIACALSVGLANVDTPFAQSNHSDDYWSADVTVMTIAPDGTMGNSNRPLHKCRTDRGHKGVQ
jgi:hypothetical protein